MDQRDGYGGANTYEFDVKEQDLWLPIANVTRIMKDALPGNAKIAKEAKECMQECVSEYILFITSEASEKCQQEKRKTINGEDILLAITSLSFENYAEALKTYLTKYRETQATRGGGAPAQDVGAVGPGAEQPGYPAPDQAGGGSQLQNVYPGGALHNGAGGP